MPSKHIKVNKQENGSFSFDVLPFPDDLSKQEGLTEGGNPLKSIEREFDGSTYYLYYYAVFSEEDVQEFKSEWDNNGPEPSNMIFSEQRLK